MAHRSQPTPKDIAEVFALANRVIAVLDKCESPLTIIRALEMVTATFCRNAPNRADSLLLARGIANHVQQMIEQDRRDGAPNEPTMQ